MTQKAKIHLSRDPIMKKLISKHSLEKTGEPQSLFLELVDIITSQQLSVKAGRTIYNRVLSLLTKSPAKILPKDMLALTHDQLRSAGLSGSKATYVLGLADSVHNNRIILDHLKNLSNDEVSKEITKLKGLGPWSAEMFLMFYLQRPDVFAIGDLGLRTAVSNLYGVNREDQEKIIDISESWAPYRTLASRYLWASLEND